MTHDRVGDRAVVLGGGMAGLLAARVLADAFRQVIVVDRDGLAGATGPRRSIPHGRHAHALLARGGLVLEELFPGLHDDMTEAGVLSGDLSGNLRWYFDGHRLPSTPCGLRSVSATRPVLEAHVRTRVAALPEVEFRERCTIRGLRTSAARDRVVGVDVVSEADATAAQTVEADLVVDATGRGSRTPVWLEELGYAPPAEDRVTIDMAYTTRHFRLRDDPYGTDLSINPVASPAHPRGAFFPRLGDGVSMLSLTGILGDHPPTDPAGFLEFTRSLPAPEIHAAIRGAEPLDDAVTFRVRASVRRRYERLSRFPSGLLVIGDGVCAFNPVYGQGMTVAALEATALRELLRRGQQPTGPRWFAAIAPLIDVPWDISTGGDLGFPGVLGDRTVKVRLGNAYMGRLHAAATRDPAVVRAFFRVAGLVDPMGTLVSPSMMLRVLKPAPRGRSGSPPPPRTDPGADAPRRAA